MDTQATRLLLDVVWPSVQNLLAGWTLMVYGAVFWSVLHVCGKGIDLPIIRWTLKMLRFVWTWLLRQGKQTLACIVILMVVWLLSKDNDSPEAHSSTGLTCEGNCSVTHLTATQLNVIDNLPDYLDIGDNMLWYQAYNYSTSSLNLTNTQGEVRNGVDDIQRQVMAWALSSEALPEVVYSRAEQLKEAVEACELLHDQTYGPEGEDTRLRKMISVAKTLVEAALSAREEGVSAWIGKRAVGVGLRRISKMARNFVDASGDGRWPSMLHDFELINAVQRLSGSESTLDQIQDAGIRLGGCQTSRAKKIGEDLARFGSILSKSVFVQGSWEKAFVEGAAKEWTLRMED